MALLQSDLNREWKPIDFKLNALIWKARGEESLDIRRRNLIDLFAILKNSNICVWLQGKTLLNAVTKNELVENDHDEDIGILYEEWIKKGEQVHEQLLTKGFSQIRDTVDIVSYIRNDRYIDICLFRKHRSKLGYQNKFFPKHFFDRLDSLDFLGYNFLIPNNVDKLLGLMYGENIVPRPNMIKRIVMKVFTPSAYFKKGKFFVTKIINHTPHNLRWMINCFPFLGVKYKKLSKDAFLDILIEPIDSPNWYWRKPHLDIVTNNKQNVRVRDIINFFKNESNFNYTKSLIVETDTRQCFSEPNNLDYNFWNSGNNYFIYCIIYQFRREVVAYNKANDYIKLKRGISLYSKEYFERLEPMSDTEIKKILEDHPIEIENNACTSGKHRVFAMIGRLIEDKPYIPFNSFIKY